jgi:hypothetical protein
VRHRFQGLPGHAGRPRPVVDLVVEGLELAPQACLLDTGATEIRMGVHVAQLAGIDLGAGVDQEIIIGGVRTTGRGVPVGLELRQGRDSHAWSPTVYFCDPWPWAFGLLGLNGLDPFLVTISAHEEWSELTPIQQREHVIERI